MISPSFRRRQTHTDTLTDTLSVRASVAPFPCKTRLGGALLLRLGDATLLESVLEPPGQGLDVPAAASAGSPTALSLGGPVVSAHVLGRISAGSTRRLLEVVGAFATTTAQRVRLVVALTEACSTLAYNLQALTNVSLILLRTHNSNPHLYQITAPPAHMCS